MLRLGFKRVASRREPKSGRCASPVCVGGVGLGTDAEGMVPGVPRVKIVSKSKACDV